MPRFSLPSSTRWALAASGLLAAAGAEAQQPMVQARVLAAQPVMEQVPLQYCRPGRYTGPGAAAQTPHSSWGSDCRTHHEQRVQAYAVTYEYAGRQYHTRMAQAPGQWIQVPAPVGYASATPVHGDASGVQTWPVQPAPVNSYPMPTHAQQPQVGDGHDSHDAHARSAPFYPQPQAFPAQPVYAQAVYAQPVYVQPVYPQPVYVHPAPRYVSPIGVSLSVGGRIGRRAGVGLGLGFGF